MASRDGKKKGEKGGKGGGIEGTVFPATRTNEGSSSEGRRERKKRRRKVFETRDKKGRRRWVNRGDRARGGERESSWRCVSRSNRRRDIKSPRVGGDRRTVAFALKSADPRLYFLCIKCSGQLAARSWRTIIV